MSSDVMLKYQKWRHWYRWSRTPGSVSRPPQPNCTFVSSSKVTCSGNAHLFCCLLSLCYVINIRSYFKPFSPLVIAWSIRKCFNQSIRTTKEQKTRLHCLASAMPKPFNASRSYEKVQASKKKKGKDQAVLAKTPRLNRFFQQNFQAATLKPWR